MPPSKSGEAYLSGRKMAIMESILEKFHLTGELSGAGTGSWLKCHGEELVSISPIDGQPLATVRCASGKDYEDVVCRATEAFEHWHRVPAPRRGEIVRQTTSS